MPRGEIINFDDFRNRREAEASEVDHKETLGKEEMFQGLMEGLLKPEGLEMISGFIGIAQLSEKPIGRIIKGIRGQISISSTTYKESYQRAIKLSMEEVFGQLSEATEQQINSHPTWYCVLWDYYVAQNMKI